MIYNDIEIIDRNFMLDSVSTASGIVFPTFLSKEKRKVVAYFDTLNSSVDVNVVFKNPVTNGLWNSNISPLRLNPNSLYLLSIEYSSANLFNAILSLLDTVEANTETTTTICENQASIKEITGYFHKARAIDKLTGMLFYYDADSTAVSDENITVLLPNNQLEELSGRWVSYLKMDEQREFISLSINTPEGNETTDYIGWDKLFYKYAVTPSDETELTINLNLLPVAGSVFFLDRLKRHLNLDDDQADDDLLQSLLEASITWCEGRINSFIVPAEIKQVIYDFTGNKILVDHGGFHQVKSLLIGGVETNAFRTIRKSRSTTIELTNSVGSKSEVELVYTAGLSPKANLLQAVFIKAADLYDTDRSDYSAGLQNNETVMRLLNLK